MIAIRRLGLLFLLTLPLHAAWLEDLGKAQEKAVEEKKDLLVVFTSLKISGECVQFEKRVLSQEKFQKALSEQFILVHLDVPAQKAPDAAELPVTKRMIAKSYGVRNYPSVFYLDSSGVTYATDAASLAGGPMEAAEQVLQKWKDEQERREGLERAYQKEGLERASAIIDIIRNPVSGADPARNAKHLTELARLDPDDTLDFQRNREAEIAFLELEKTLRNIFQEGTHGKGVELVDTYVANFKPKGELLQKALFRKLVALNHAGKTPDAKTTAEKLIELDPNSPHGRFAAQILQRLKKP